jgi:hypothetical protein
VGTVDKDSVTYNIFFGEDGNLSGDAMTKHGGFRVCYVALVAENCMPKSHVERGSHLCPPFTNPCQELSVLMCSH